MSDTLPRYGEPNGSRGVVIEDDGRTVYAYLVDGAGILAHVWLRNSAEIADVRWDDPDDMPFPNKPENIEPIDLVLDESTPFECVWDDAGVDLFVGVVRVARLENEAPCGWSRTIRVDSPLGNRLLDR